jgi:hypothetical protein
MVSANFFVSLRKVEILPNERFGMRSEFDFAQPLACASGYCK